MVELGGSDAELLNGDLPGGGKLDAGGQIGDEPVELDLSLMHMLVLVLALEHS